jgi:AraC-like DNA-binding protein
MKIDLFKPINEELQKYIESFYILTNSKNDEKVSYLTFPTLFSVVAVVANAENIISSEKVTIKFSASKSLDSSLVCRFNKPICVQYEGEIKEICIYFKPLGLNAFLGKSLESYSSSFVDEFIPFLDYEVSMKKILRTEDMTLLSLKIEQYWLKKLIGFQHPFLHEALNMMHKDPNITTLDLANELKISQKTLIKHFKRHLCKTPTEYKKIFRFRIALNENQLPNNGKLTQLALASNFYDQSHMISNFKSLTGFTPKLFFKNLSTTVTGNINWIFNER